MELEDGLTWESILDFIQELYVNISKIVISRITEVKECLVFRSLLDF